MPEATPAQKMLFTAICLEISFAPSSETSIDGGLLLGL